MISTIVIAAIAYVGGCFSPGIGRKIKAAISKDKAAVEADVKKDIPKI
jgi:formate hydrogenlyase subunit 4